MRTLKRQDGFTLVELMVVVAIIGLLSAVAVPNFKKYQARSKMAEAKLQLSALYTAQSSFYSDYNMYGQCLPYMGFDPTAERMNRYYATGFAASSAINGTLTTGAYGAAVNSGLNDIDCPITSDGVPSVVVGATQSPNQTAWFPAGKGIGASIADTRGFLTAGAVGTNTGTFFGDQSTQALMVFNAGAAGVISVDSPTFGVAGTSSFLTIDNLKVLRTQRNGF